MKKIIIIGVILLVVVGGALLLLTSRKPVPPKSRVLTIWGVYDDAEYYQDIINAYQAQHPYIKINYKKYRPEEYENLLVSSWAKDAGPDIFLVPNYSIYKYKDFISPLPKQTRMAYYVKSKVLGIKEEVKIEWRTIASLTPDNLKNNFIDVVSDDVVFDNTIYGLPLYTDTLMLFYNKDLLFKAGAAEPPQTWDSFVPLVSKMTSWDTNNNIIKSGTALGTYDNIPRAFDIISLLMMQNGTQLVNKETGDVNFQNPSLTDPTFFPGEEAVRFYTDFASPTKEVYSWNSQMPDALESFASGNLAFFFGYTYQMPTVDAQATRLNYSISYFPQINTSQMVNYANYWVMTVAKASPNANEAWNFIQFAANEQNVKSYLTKAGRVSVLRSILSQQLTEDPQSNIYKLARQALTAKSWYHGNSPQKVEEYFKTMIDSVNSGQATISEAIRLAAQLTQQTL